MSLSETISKAVDDAVDEAVEAVKQQAKEALYDARDALVNQIRELGQDVMVWLTGLF